MNFHFFQCPILGVRENIWDRSNGSTFSFLVGSTCEATGSQANGNGLGNGGAYISTAVPYNLCLR